MGLVVKDDNWRIPDKLWEQMEPLLPPPPKHPLGCHNPRIPDRDALNGLDNYRQKIMKKMFRNKESADRIITRALGPNVTLTTLLRAYYDPEYMLGELQQEPQSDLLNAGLGCSSKITGMQTNAREDMGYWINLLPDIALF